MCKRSREVVVLKCYLMSSICELYQHQIYREVRLHSSCNHENIVKLFAAFQVSECKHLLLNCITRMMLPNSQCQLLLWFLMRFAAEVNYTSQNCVPGKPTCQLQWDNCSIIAISSHQWPAPVSLPQHT